MAGGAVASACDSSVAAARDGSAPAEPASFFFDVRRFAPFFFLDTGLRRVFGLGFFEATVSPSTKTSGAPSPQADPFLTPRAAQPLSVSVSFGANASEKS